MNKRATKSSRDSSGSKSRAHRISTPIMLQMHASECGAACLGSVLGFFGRWVPLAELREKCEVSRDGSSAASIARAARHYGLECKGLSVRAELLEKLPLPLILFWQFSHFVVLEGIENQQYYLNDPATGRRTLTSEEFLKHYSGIALRFAPQDDFEQGGEWPSMYGQLKTLLSGSWKVLSGVVSCGLMLTLVALVIPIALGIFVDEVLLRSGPWLGVVASLIGGGLLVYALSLLKFRFLKRLGIRIAVKGSEWSLTKLLRLPVEFFEHRLIGDLTDRVSSIDRVSKNLSTEFLVLIVDMAMSVVFVGAMFIYHPMLTLAVLLLGLTHIALGHFLNLTRRVRSQTMRREQGLLIGVGMQMLSHADNLRMTGADDRFFSRWGGQQARELKARQEYAEMSTLNNSFPDLISMLRTAVVLVLGGASVMSGEMTLGALVAFFVLSEMFLEPIGSFLGFADKRQAFETDIQRLSDVTSATADPVFKRRDSQSDNIATFQKRLQLAGRVELRNVKFGYNTSQPPLIKDFSLTINPGQRVAVVGSSGSGKSTLTRLVSGISQPWSGEVLFDGHPRSEIPEEVLRRSISMVNQEEVLFAASLRDNITLWNSAVPVNLIVAATRDACIHNDILLRKQGYATMVEEGGANFSGGQRQRIEIARALVGNPTILILDEATSSLDAATEEEIDDSLRRRGVTCLIVAHRLSTIRDCDEVIVLEKGEVVQQGTHDELIADRDSTYYKLVASS